VVRKEEGTIGKEEGDKYGQWGRKYDQSIPLACLKMS
jgi:hypothetical protein